MQLNGQTCFRSDLPLHPFLRRKSVVLIAALMLSGCVATAPTVTTVPAQPAAPVEAQPEAEVIPDEVRAMYAAKSDGKFTVPTLPVEKIPPQYRRQIVDYPTNQPPGTIIIDPTPKFLYYVMGNGKAIRYGISVGAEGFQWSGEAVVSRKRTWPTWTPPKEMIARKPSLAKWENGQPGGPDNPLGSRAIYLTSNGVDYGYRIHGTPEWRTIGRNASSGCFRMINQDVMDLFERVKGGEKVIVLTKSGEMPTKLSIPKPATPPKPPAPKPAAAPATPATPVMPLPKLEDLTPPAALTGAPPAAGTTTAQQPATTAPVTTAPETTSPVTTSPVTTAPVTPAPAAPAADAPAVNSQPPLLPEAPKPLTPAN